MSDFDIEAIRQKLREDETHRSPKSHVVRSSGNGGKPHQGSPTTYQPYKGNNTQPHRPNQPQGRYQRSNLTPNALVGIAIKIYEWIDQLFKSFGIVTGGIATSLADWVLGAITMTILLSGYSGFESWMKWTTGAIFSLALWGIQIILWRIILTGRIKRIERISSQATFWMTVGVFVLIGLMKFGDDFTDIVGVYWMIRENPMQVALSAGLYKVMLGIIFFLAWIVCGFAEVFVALSINLLKDDNKGQ